MTAPKVRDTSPIYRVDLEKLYNAVDVKRRQNRLSWNRLAQRLGYNESTISGINRTHSHGNSPKKDINASVFISVLMFLDRPMTDFIKETKREIYDDANGS